MRKALQAEVKGAKIETVTLEQGEDGETVYWAEWPRSTARRTRSASSRDGTLAEMNLAVDEEEVPSTAPRRPCGRLTFQGESFGAKVEVVTLAKDIKYGVTIYEATVEHKGKQYEIAVAEDGTLVEKVLVIDDDVVDLAACPAAVKTALHDQAKGGRIGDVTRSTGIGRHTFEAEVEIKGKVYLIEVDEEGLLLSKSLEAGAN